MQIKGITLDIKSYESKLLKIYKYADGYELIDDVSKKITKIFKTPLHIPIDVAKLVPNAPEKISTEQLPESTGLKGMRIAKHVHHPKAYKKVSWSNEQEVCHFLIKFQKFFCCCHFLAFY